MQLVTGIAGREVGRVVRWQKSWFYVAHVEWILSQPPRNYEIFYGSIDELWRPETIGRMEACVSDRNVCCDPTSAAHSGACRMREMEFSKSVQRGQDEQSDYSQAADGDKDDDQGAVGVVKSMTRRTLLSS